MQLSDYKLSFVTCEKAFTVPNPAIVFENSGFLLSCRTLDYLRASMAQSSEQAHFTSEFVGSILATDSCEKSQSTLCRKSWVFSGCSGFLPQGKLTGWVRINIVRKVITIVVKVNSLIISLTKLLDADWLRGVQLFH
jgi:hypothetical protein